MRALRLIALAAQAEGLLLRRQTATVGRAAVLNIAAAVFGVAALGLLHAAGWIALEERLGALAAALILAGADAAIMALLLVLARPRPDPVAEEALRLRTQTISLLAGPPPGAASTDWERLALEVAGILAERWLRR